jgi:hypothetical protein
MIAYYLSRAVCRLVGHDMSPTIRFGDVVTWRGCRRCGELEVDDR